jgi:hypothetical protein
MSDFELSYFANIEKCPLADRPAITKIPKIIKKIHVQLRLEKNTRNLLNTHSMAVFVYESKIGFANLKIIKNTNKTAVGITINFIFLLNAEYFLGITIDFRIKENPFINEIGKLKSPDGSAVKIDFKAG